MPNVILLTANYVYHTFTYTYNIHISRICGMLHVYTVHSICGRQIWHLRKSWFFQLSYFVSLVSFSSFSLCNLSIWFISAVCVCLRPSPISCIYYIAHHLPMCVCVCAVAPLCYHSLAILCFCLQNFQRKLSNKSIKIALHQLLFHS